MKLIRRDFLQFTGATIATIVTASSARSQQTGPKIVQVLRKDLLGQDHVVQESVVNAVEFGPGIASPWHVHPGAQEILFVQEGSLTVEVEGGEHSALRAGEAYIIAADIPHLVRNESAREAAKGLVVYSRSSKEKPLVVPVRRGT